jgi:hypothetical protein
VVAEPLVVHRQLVNLHSLVDEDVVDRDRRDRAAVVRPSGGDQAVTVGRREF